MPLELLREGRDIAQCFGPAGFRPVDRLRSLARGSLPPLVHAMGVKPWETLGRTRAVGMSHIPVKARARQRYTRAHLLASPYVLAASTYADQLSEPPPWWLRTSPVSAARAATAELPLATIDSASRRVKALLGLDRYQIGA